MKSNYILILTSLFLTESLNETTPSYHDGRVKALPSDHLSIETLTGRRKAHSRSACSSLHKYRCLCPVSFFSSSLLLICIRFKVPINGKFPNSPLGEAAEGALGVCVLPVDLREPVCCPVLACMFAVVEHSVCDALAHSISLSFLIPEHAKWLIKTLSPNQVPS